MSDYTPTTEEVRNAFSLMDDDKATQENFQNFDRWLFEMQEDAWDSGYQAGLIDYASSMATNPYRIIVSNNDYDQLRNALDNG